MKNVFCYLSLLLLCASCAQEPEPVVAIPTIITGHFANHLKYTGTEKVMAKTAVYWLGDLAESEIAEDGSFRLEFPLHEDEQVRLHPFNSTYVSTAPGDSIHVVINVDSIAGVVFSGHQQEVNNKLYTFHNGGFLESWDYNKQVLKELSLRDAMLYLSSFYDMDTVRLNNFIRAEAPTKDMTAFLSAYLLNRHFVLLFEHGQDRQQEDLQALKPDTEAYFELVAEKLRNQLPELRKHPDFKKTMFTYTGYYCYYKLHGPYHKLITSSEDYHTFHQAVKEEPSLTLQRAMLYSFGATLISIDKPGFFAEFWAGMSSDQREGKELKKLYQQYLQAYPPAI